MMNLAPLNGTHTHPLSSHDRALLRDLDARGPMPTQSIKPGVVDRFHRGALTETVDRPSPFRSTRGKNIPHEQITDAGRAALIA
jgi:hypothetical protein